MLYAVAIVGVVLVLVAVWGLRMPRTEYFNRDVLINAPVEAVWNAVADPLKQVKWRTDLRSVQIGDMAPANQEWLEHRRRGGPVKLRVIRRRQLQLLELERTSDGESSTQWTGTFEKAASATRLHIAETVTTTDDNPFTRVFNHLFFNRGAAIERFQRDLKDYLEAASTTERG